MQELEKILEEIKAHRNFASECGNFNVASAFELCEEIIRKHMNDGWIPVEERLPEDDRYIFLSVKGYKFPLIGRYEEDDEGGAFYIGKEKETSISRGLHVKRVDAYSEAVLDGKE